MARRLLILLGNSIKSIGCFIFRLDADFELKLL